MRPPGFFDELVARAAEELLEEKLDQLDEDQEHVQNQRQELQNVISGDLILLNPPHENRDEGDSGEEADDNLTPFG
jgi:adenine-specific DNA methylase